MDVTRIGDIDVIFVEEVLHRSLHIKANQLVMFARVCIVPKFISENSVRWLVGVSV